MTKNNIVDLDAMLADPQDSDMPVEPAAVPAVPERNNYSLGRAVLDYLELQARHERLLGELAAAAERIRTETAGELRSLVVRRAVYGQSYLVKFRQQNDGQIVFMTEEVDVA